MSTSSSLSVIYFDAGCYAIHNCIHISLSMALRIVSLGFKHLCLLRYVKNVFCFLRSHVPSTFPVHFYVLHAQEMSFVCE